MYTVEMLDIGSIGYAIEVCIQITEGIKSEEILQQTVADEVPWATFPIKLMLQSPEQKIEKTLLRFFAH
jgi:hypothetical protein